MAEEHKWLTDPDDYICTLSEETQKIAKEQLKEDDLTRKQALASIRNWIIENPRISNCRLDSKFLLRFLRFKKFNITHAQNALERYLLLRQTYGIAFNHLDMTIPMMEDLINRGFIVACPKRDSKGRRVLIGRAVMFDMNKFTNGDMLRIAGICAETLMEDEENQVRGFVYFGDAQGAGLNFLTLFTPREAVRLIKNGEKTLPMRHKEVHGVNVPTSMKFLLDFGISLVSDKIKKRVKIYNSLEQALASGNLEPDVLPKEYGGTMPIGEMIELWKEELKQSHSYLMSHDKMTIREELFSAQEREGAVSALKKEAISCGIEEDTFFGVTGNFRKLEVD